MLLRRTLPAVLAALALAGCPSVDRDESPARIAVATFDPTTGVIPTPNDLALQRAPAQVGLQQRLLLGFVANGGWPADQEVSVNIPVAVRARQADGAYAQPTPADIDLATVNDESVAFLQTNLQADPVRILRCPTSGAPTATCWEPTSANGVLTLRRSGPDGHRRWAGGGRYVVALRNTIRTTDGLTLGADQAIALIAPNQSLTNPELQPPGAAPAQLASLEQLRGLYATGRLWNTVPDPAICAANGVPVAPCWLPLPTGGTTGIPEQRSAFSAVATVFPTAEMASIQTFTVSGATFVRALTDSGSGQVPLPSDFLLDPATGRVRNIPAFGPAAAGLATLDGFSTTAPLLMPLTGAVKASTITAGTVRMFEVTATGLVPVVGLSVLPGAPPPSGPPQVLVQPPTAIGADGSATSIVLAPAVPIEAGATNLYLPPLKEKTQYLVVVTSGVTDPQDRPMRRSTLMDIVFTHTPVGPNDAVDICAPAGQPTCTSRIPGVSNADAAGLQRLRDSVGPALRGLGLLDCSGNATCAVLAYTVKTQSVRDVTKLLSAAPYAIEREAQQAVFAPSATAEFTLPAGLGITPTFTNVARVFRSTFPTLYAIQGSTGAFDPAFATWTPAEIAQHLRPIPVLVAVPTAAAALAAGQPLCPPPADALRCVPVVIYQHGLGGSTWQMLAVADALAAKGFVVAAIDMPYHGERSYCRSNDECEQNGAAGVCTPDPTLATPADAIAPGTCTTGTFALNPNLYAPRASGNYFVSSNFFRSRDALRQHVLDLSALTLALARPPAPEYPFQPSANDLRDAIGAAGIAIDPTKIYFSGFSTGGMAGVPAVATNPRLSRASFTESGATIVDVFTQAPANQPSLPAVFAPLGIDLNCVLTGAGCDAATRAAQSARYAQALALAKWILDPAEPLNYAADVTTKDIQEDFDLGALASPGTTTYGQLVTGAQTVPNQNARELFARAAVGFTTYTSLGAIPPGERHNLFIRNFLAPGDPLQQGGDRMRNDLADFFAGTVPPTTRDVP